MPKALPKRAAAILLSVIATVVVLGAMWTWFTLSWSYAEGERAGFLQKFSKKGWLCKTWEGEILLASMPGAIPERFAFSVRDPAVVKQLQENIDKRVRISYEQHKGVPTTCFAETEYFATRVISGADNSAQQGQAPDQVPEQVPNKAQNLPSQTAVQ